MSSYAPYIERRKLLHKALMAAHPGKGSSSTLCGLLEHEKNKHAFRQDSTFYYSNGP